MLLKQEKPEMDDFEGKNFVLKYTFEKCHKISLHILLFQNILSIYFILRKKLCIFVFQFFYMLSNDHIDFVVDSRVLPPADHLDLVDDRTEGFYHLLITLTLLITEDHFDDHSDNVVDGRRVLPPEYHLDDHSDHVIDDWRVPPPYDHFDDHSDHVVDDRRVLPPDDYTGRV